MRRYPAKDETALVYAPRRLKRWRRIVSYNNADRLCKGAADLVLYRLSAPVPAAAGKRIAFVSDLHYKGTELQQREIAVLRNYLLEYKPDLLLCGGDVSGDVDMFHLFPEVLKPLSSAVPCALAVPGNWERGKPWIPVERWSELFASGGFDLMFNEFRAFDVFQIFGVDDPAWGNPVAPEKWEDGKVRILLAHRPDTAIALDEPGGEVPHLILCGHTHGGQIRLPLVGSVFAASIYGCALDYGCFQNQQSNARMIVSSGLGNLSFPLRINCRREMLLIEFF